MTPARDDNARRLEDEFFIKEDAKLIEKLKQIRKMEESVDALASASGIKNRAILQKLAELNVQPETLAALTVYPFVAIAWADGKVDQKERTQVLEAATRLAFTKGDVDYQLLEQWLTHKPEPRLFDAWSPCLRGILGQMTPDEVTAARKGMLDMARSVAGATGGFLGMGKTSAEEERVIQKLEGAFVGV